MKDLISRKTAIETAVEWLKTEDPYIAPKSLVEALSAVPPITEADVEKVRHGYWVYEKGDCFPKCSVCGQYHGTLYEHYYCPVCGAKMDGDIE